MRSMKLLCFLNCALLLGAVQAMAATPTPAPLAQTLVNDSIAQHGDVAIMLIHATPPGKSDATDNTVVAGNLPDAIGNPSGADDLDTIKDGISVVEKQKNGIRTSVLIPLFDKSGRTVGALGFVFIFRPGDPDSKFLAEAEAIRDAIKDRIQSQAALFGPAPTN